MVKLFVGTDDEFYMDGYLKQNLDITYNAMRDDLDMVFVVDGDEGSGKSLLAMQCCKYIYPKFSFKNLVFTPSAFKKAIYAAEKYGAVSYDEAYFGLSARGAMTYINQVLVSMLTQIRQKNLFVTVVLPSFFDLDKYVALHRSRALLHVYFTGNFKRGQFAFFNKDKKKDLYVEGKKTYSYSKPMANFVGSFTNKYVVNEEEYRRLKMDALVGKRDETEIKDAMHKVKSEMFNRMIDLKISGMPMSDAMIMQSLGISRGTFYTRLKRLMQERMMEGKPITEIVEDSSLEGTE
jgi:hypothetical protein